MVAVFVPWSGVVGGALMGLAIIVFVSVVGGLFLRGL
jgi:hypothetical protein